MLSQSCLPTIDFVIYKVFISYIKYLFFLETNVKFKCKMYIQRVPKLSPKNVTQQFPISILTQNRNQTFFF
jgi:hypothetical protein